LLDLGLTVTVREAIFCFGTHRSYTHETFFGLRSF